MNSSETWDIKKQKNILRQEKTFIKQNSRNTTNY